MCQFCEACFKYWSHSDAAPVVIHPVVALNARITELSTALHGGEQVLKLPYSRTSPVNGAATGSCDAENYSRQATTEHDKKLHVQAFRNTLLLLVENLLFGLLEIVVGHSHASLSQRQQASLCAYCLDIGSR